MRNTEHNPVSWYLIVGNILLFILTLPYPQVTIKMTQKEQRNKSESSVISLFHSQNIKFSVLLFYTV